MLRAVICKGDRTTHGGEVIEGDDTCTTDGRAITRRGHMTFCPQCKGKFPIDDGVASFMFGDAVVVDGMRAACGATIIASQHTMLIDDGAGEGGEPAAEKASAPQNSDLLASFLVVAEDTGLPLSGIRYSIVLPDGTSRQGVTNAAGRTMALTAHERATATLQLGGDAPSDGA